jgi:hypothetical protein
MVRYLIQAAFYLPSESAEKVLNAAKQASRLAGVKNVGWKQGEHKKYIGCDATPKSAEKLEKILNAAGFEAVHVKPAKDFWV